jgi:hypothetical protein
MPAARTATPRCLCPTRHQVLLPHRDPPRPPKPAPAPAIPPLPKSVPAPPTLVACLWPSPPMPTPTPTPVRPGRFRGHDRDHRCPPPMPRSAKPCRGWLADGVPYPMPNPQSDSDTGPLPHRLSVPRRRCSPDAYLQQREAPARSDCCDSAITVFVCLEQQAFVCLLTLTVTRCAKFTPFSRFQ